MSKPTASQSSSYPPSAVSDKDAEAARAPPTDTYDDAIVRVTSTATDEPEKRHFAAPLAAARTPSECGFAAAVGTPFEVRWAPDDAESPLNWPRRRKGWVLALVSMQTLVVCVAPAPAPRDRPVAGVLTARAAS